MRQRLLSSPSTKPTDTQYWPLRVGENPALKVLPALMAAITAAFVTQPVFGSVIDLDHQLIFTENSSSSLSATYDGATLTPTFVSTDEWTLQTNVRSLFVVVFPQWEEPGSASSINVFQLSGSHGLVTIDSDQSGDTVFGDGFTFVAVGTDSSDGVPVDVTFNDQ